LGERYNKPMRQDFYGLHGRVRLNGLEGKKLVGEKRVRRKFDEGGIASTWQRGQVRRQKWIREKEICKDQKKKRKEEGGLGPKGKKGEWCEKREGTRGQHVPAGTVSIGTTHTKKKGNDVGKGGKEKERLRKGGEHGRKAQQIQERRSLTTMSHGDRDQDERRSR